MRIRIVVALLILAALGAFVFFRVHKTVSAPPNYSPTHEIVLGEKGFSPNELVVPVGTTVTFTTTLSRYFWPASNNHPTHTLYPEFDPKRPIPHNESYQFTFEKVGTWGFHDHLSPYFTGTITVVGTSTAAVACDPKKNQDACFQADILSALEAKGIGAAYQRLTEIYAEHPEFRTSCHSITHNIGLEAYRYYLQDPKSVLTPLASACGYGFYHGFQEALLTATRDPNAARSFCLMLKDNANLQGPDAYLQCFHGIGHGAVDLMLGTFGFRDDVVSLANESVKICRETSKSDEELYRCTSGVYNGIANIYIDGGYLSVNTKEPAWICRTQPAAYKESCYGNMNSLFFKVAGNNLARAVPYIATVEPTYRAASIRYLSGLSVIWGILSVNDGYAGEVDACRLADASLLGPCIEGLVQGLLEHGAPNKEYEDVLTLCALPDLTASERTSCYGYLSSNIKGWYEGKTLQTVCSRVPTAYRNSCGV